ncbi:MAG: hypothetical protein LW645_04640 [Verrucomicrobiaceae bacterium]|nr:hypothetical protein [Verrucomicrobiaceae bacterium]
MRVAPSAVLKVAGEPLADFAAWTDDYLQASPAEKARLLEQGLKLAQERRPVFKALIMDNPREAIAKAVPMVVRQKLPPEIVVLLEKRLNEIGAIRVMQGVPLDLNEPPVPTYREVELQKGGTYRAYVYGDRELKLAWTPGASVNGVAMDSEFAISDEPTRRLEVGEILPAGKTVVGDCPVSGKYVLEPEDVPAEVPETLVAVETPVEIITFCDGSHIAVHNQTILYGEGVTGGSMAFSGILPGSPTPAVGQVKVIVLNVTYADQNALPSTEAELYNVLRDVADHYSKASYGRLSLSGVVAPPRCGAAAIASGFGRMRSAMRLRSVTRTSGTPRARAASATGPIRNTAIATTSWAAQAPRGITTRRRRRRSSGYRLRFSSR